MSKALIEYIRHALNITKKSLGLGDALPAYSFEALFVRFYPEETAVKVARDE